MHSFPSFFVSAPPGARRVLAVPVFALTLALASILPTTAGAQETGAVSGRVVTADAEPVTDAAVTDVATGAYATTDEDGRFLLEGLPAGIRLLEVTSVRHAQGVERVGVVAGEAVEVEILLVSSVHAEKIVVTASPSSRGELDLASPVTVLDDMELAREVEASLGETLSHEAGISSTYFAPGASRPVIRGLGGSRVKMMENGLDTLDASSTSPDHAVAVDPASAERIEVVRGPATLLYGSNAIGGVVNVLDRRIPDRRRESLFSGTVDLGGGTVADERIAGVDVEGGAGRWAWHADLLTRESDDYEIPGRPSVEEDGVEEDVDEAVSGILPNSDVSSDSGGLGASYFFGDAGFLGVSLRSLDSRYGVPGGGEHGEEEENGEEGIRIDLEQRRFDLESAVTRPFAGFRAAKIRFGLVDYEHAELEGPGEVGTRFFNDAWEGRVELVQKEREAHGGSVGLQVSSRDLEAIGEEAFILPSKTENLGLFTFQELGDGPVRYQAGLRWESQETTVRDPGLPDRSFAGLSASLGVVWKPSAGYSLGASAARSTKMPTGEELYSEGVHFATASFELGDPGLDEETALGLDVALRKVDGKLTGSFNLFYNAFSDFIFQRFTGDEAEGFPVVQWSQADASFWGAELDLTISLARRAHSSWDLDLLWDFVRAELDDGGDLPRIPPQRFGVGVHYRGDRLRAGARVRRVDDQDRVAVNETPTDGHTLVDADVSYRFFLAEQVLDLLLRGKNLTDEEARNHVSFVKDEVPLPGRDVSLSLRWMF